MSSTIGTPRRPGVVTFIGVILYVQAFLAAVEAIVLFAFKDRVNDFLTVHGGAQSDGSIVGAAIGSAIAAILLALVGGGILAGRRGWRNLVVIVQALAMGWALWTMVTHPHTAFVTRGLVTLLVGFFVIWALYGNKESYDYFEAS